MSSSGGIGWRASGAFSRTQVCALMNQKVGAGCCSAFWVLFHRAVLLIGGDVGER